MPSNINGQNAGLSGLWNELSDYPRIRLHKTIHFGYPLVHVLDDEGRELARRIHSTDHWGWRLRMRFNEATDEEIDPQRGDCIELLSRADALQAFRSLREGTASA